MKSRLTFSLLKGFSDASNVASRILVHTRRCPFSNTLYLSALFFYSITFYYALEQTTVMTSELAKLIISFLIGVPTITAVLALMTGSSCSLDTGNRV